MLNQLKETPAYKRAVKTLKAVKEGITPEFVNRILNSRTYKLQLKLSEENLTSEEQSKSNTIIEEYKFYEKQKKQNAKLKRDADRKLAGEQKQQEIIRRDAEKKRKAQRDDFQNNRYLQLKEKEAIETKGAESLQAFQEQVDLERRTNLTNFWGEQAILLQNEADITHKEHLRQVQKKYDFTLDQLGEEYKERDLARVKLQVIPSSVSDPIELPNSQLGVFGTPLGPGEYFAADGGFIPGLDQQDIHVFESSPQTDYESSLFELSDFNSELDRNQGLYDALNQDVKYLEESVERMVELRNMHERDLRQLENENILVLNAQLGPPKRLADKFEIHATHHRKEQQSLLTRRLEDLQHSLDIAEHKKRDKESQMLLIAQKIAVLGEKVKIFETAVNNVNDGRGQLPIVVGKNISKIRGNGPTAKPKEYFDAVVHQSKLVSYRELEKDALKAHNSRVNIDRNLWLANQSESELKLDVERTFSSLTEIQERMRSSLINSHKLSVVEALSAFFNSGTKLVPRGLHYSGLLHWWKTRNPKLSNNINVYSGGNALGGISFDEPDESVEENEVSKTGVVLDAAHHGECYGLIKLPKMGLWNIVFSVTRSKLDPDAIPNESDYVVIRLGPSFASLQLIDHYFNRINPETGAVLYDVKFLLRGDKLAYKFEFSSSSLNPNGHLAVCTGFYEEYQMQALEYIKDPKSDKQRVLSSYVKILRVEEAQGKQRLTKLLEELIAVEDYQGPFWDSEIIQKTSQRYEKNFFLRILKAEILAELHKVKSMGLAKVDNEEHNDEDVEKETELARQERIEHSKKLFIKRKQENQNYLIEKAEKEVGKFLEIYEEATDQWIQTYVKDVKVDWIDNGMTVQIVHIVEEVNKGGEELNTFHVDLSKRRYFESAQQEFNQEAINKWKQNRAWNTRLKELNNLAEDARQKYKEAFKLVKIQAENVLDAEIKALYENFDQIAEEEAISKYEDERTVEWINNRIPGIILEMRKGVIERNIDMLPKDQAILVAKDSFRQQFKVAKKEALDKLSVTKKERMQFRLSAKLEEFKKKEEEYLAQINSEKFTLEYNIREQFEIERDAALKKLKFRPEEFKKAVPYSDNCEHLKSKAWGDDYSTGVKCVYCGKELTNLCKEESQILGYGSGCDPKFYKAIIRHRKDEASFRASYSGETEKVEAERIRLEKERRLIEENEIYFYDFADLKCIYEFDQRHSQEIKKAGIFRQGLQWSEEELLDYQEKKVKEKKDYLMKENLQLDLLENYDPLVEVEEPPPTFRAQDERRKAQFKETIFGVGRMHNFQKKITFLKEARVDFLSELQLYTDILTILHRDSFIFENDLDNLEADLDRTAKLLATYEAMQLLWAQANRIEKQASKDKKKAEMRHAGLWETVKEAIDITTFLREETRAILKQKLAYETKFQERTKSFGDCRTIVDKTYQMFVQMDLSYNALNYCKPGNYVSTRYGFGKIYFYRKEDEMLLVVLPFGIPFAKLWIHSSEIINSERSKQHGERLLMEIEDNRTKKMVYNEKISIRKELFLMRNEELGMKEYWEFVDCTKYQNQLIKTGIEESIIKTYQLIDTKQFKTISDKNSFEVIKKKVDMNKESIKAFKGPKAARPKKMTSHDILVIKKNLELELKQKFLAKALRQSEKDVKEKLLQDREAFFQRYITESMLFSFVNLFIEEVAKEALTEGKEAKIAAEKISGLIFPDPSWMQHDSYRLIRDLWKDRKAFLSRNIEMKLGITNKAENASKKPEVDEAEATRILEEKRRKKLELRRQKLLCAEMDAEYLICKEFYRWELMQNLRERRLMKEEDMMMKAYIKELARLEELKKSAYNVSDGNLADQQKEISVTDYDNRRKQLKDLTIERRKIAEEIEWMIEEDKRSKMLQDLDRLERQRAAFTAVFGEDDASSLNPDDTVQVMADGNVVIPPWLVLPENWVEMNQVQQHRFVYIMTKRRTLRQNLFKNLEKERRRLEVVKKKGKKEWKELFSITQVKTWKSELDFMNAEEECKELEYQLKELEENLRKITIFCRTKGEEELHARTDLKKKEEIARKRTKELQEATDWLNLCIRRSKTREKMKRRVTNDCLFVDTDSIMGFHQRFRTEDLRDRLYWMYFQKIVHSIINRAETIATERKLMKIQESLSENRASILDRTEALKWAWKDIQRDDLLRLRRSALGVKFFPRTRKRTLQQRFGSWVRFFYWNRGHREAYTLKYEMLLRQIQIDRQFKEQLSNKKLIASSPPKHKVNASTIMQKHRERTVQCKRCIEFYLESQNNCFSCLFHTGVYTFTCPKYCKNPGLTLKCVAHKRKRWTCCDSSTENIQGCSRRYHVPKDEDPVYQDLMERINERDTELLSGLELRLDQAVKDDWILKEKEIKRDQLAFIEGIISTDRAKAVAYDKLKLI